MARAKSQVDSLKDEVAALKKVRSCTVWSEGQANGLLILAPLTRAWHTQSVSKLRRKVAQVRLSGLILVARESTG